MRLFSQNEDKAEGTRFIPQDKEKAERMNLFFQNDGKAAGTRLLYEDKGKYRYFKLHSIFKLISLGLKSISLFQALIIGPIEKQECIRRQF